MNPVSADVPSWSRAAYPCRPTTLPVNRLSATITPIVPPTTASAQEPKLTSDSSRTISRRYRLVAFGISRSAFAWKINCLPRSATLSARRVTARFSRWVLAISDALRGDELEVDRRDDEVEQEGQHEGDH